MVRCCLIDEDMLQEVIEFDYDIETLPYYVFQVKVGQCIYMVDFWTIDKDDGAYIMLGKKPKTLIEVELEDGINK